jgi:hypothetical protein
VTRHRFINDGVAPIPMGASARYACVCGKTGTREVIERHIAESATRRDPRSQSESDATPVEVEDYGGDTKLNYLPNAPRKPAPTQESIPLSRPDRAPTPEPLPSSPVPHLPPSPSVLQFTMCPRCGAGESLYDLPEISAWACGHWIRKVPLSIAESFQDMLRVSYQAGAASATTGETFETWYQREVLR